MESLRELTIAVDRISIPLRVIVFFLMTIGFIIKIKRAEFIAEAILPIIASSVIILGLITSQNWLFKQAQDVFFTITDQIKPDYEKNPYKSIESLKEAKQEQEQREGFGHLIKNIKASFLEAILNAFMHILISIASGLQVIFVCIYSILIEVFRLFFPLALACYQFDSLRSIGFNFVSKALSVMAWPVGFALIERIAQALQVHFYHSDSAFDILHGGIFFPVLVAILVIGGTLITPLLMSTLFTSGDISGSATGFARTAINVMQGVRGIATRNLVGQLSRAGNMSIQGLAKAGFGAAALLPKITRPTASESTGTKPMNNGLITYANTTGASQIKFPEVSNSTTREDSSITNKPLNAYAVSNETASSVKDSTHKQSSLFAHNSLSIEKAANLDTPKALQKRKVAQEHSKIAANSNVGKNNENEKISAPLYNGFNTPTKKPRGAATLNFNNVSYYTTKANQIAESVDKNNNLSFL